MQPEDFAETFNVPRGTLDKLLRYEILLKDWQTRMNLVGPATIPDIWTRHFADSAQLTKHSEPGKNWLDVGAGGGFPGLVLAAMDWGNFILVDSIAKKCRFLQHVTNELNLNNVRITCARVEDLAPQHADIGTARATAPLDRLLGWMKRHVQKNGQFILPKGKKWAEEVDRARKYYNFTLNTEKSITDDEARILIVRDLKRRG